MTQWEYQVTMHALPESKATGPERRIDCDQNGHCVVHDVFQGGIEWAEKIFDEQGKKGWEMVQFGYHNGELLCIWKRKKEIKKKRR